MIKSKRKINKALLIANAHLAAVPARWLNATWFRQLSQAYGTATALAMGMDARKSEHFVGDCADDMDDSVSSVVIWRDTAYEDKWRAVGF